MDKDDTQFCENWNVNTKGGLAEHELRLCKYLVEHAKECGFDRADSFMTIGPGGGSIDSYIIKSCMPNLKRFIAIEPMPELLKSVKTNMAALENVAKDFQNKRIQEYGGPNEPVSVIFAANSLYYLDDKLANEIKRSVSWLAPGGALIIVMATEKENCMLSDFRKAVPWTSLCIASNEIKEALAKSKLQYEELFMETTVDFSSEVGRHALFDLMLNRKASERERKAMQEVVDKHATPGCDVMYDTQSVFIVRKPDVKATV